MKNSTTKPRHADSTVSKFDVPGQTVGDFQILRKLGEGGMGQVYLAEQISLKRKVALKFLRDEVAGNPKALSRFQAEATTIAKLSHPNVVQAYVVGEHEGVWYLAMEYVEGISLREYLERKGPVDVPLALKILRQIASALQRAGELGIVHRDIKPENILLTRKAEAKVADFGLSRCLATEERVDLTRAGSTVGTPLYMSPEQVQGKELDGRSDMYSLGVTCYQMLAGKPPFEGSNAFEVATKHVREEPAPLQSLRKDVPAGFCALIHKMLAKKPADRHATARELLLELAQVRQALGGATRSMSAMDTPAAASPTLTSTPPEPVPVVKPRPVSRKPHLFLAAIGGAAVLACAFVAIVAIALVWWNRSPRTSDADPVPQANKKDVDTSKEVSLVALKKTVDQHLKDSTPKPAGVDDCIDLAVRYLNEDKTHDAELLFKQMCERKPPSSYYFVGRLGLAVTDALNHDHKSAKAKLTELFDAKAKDQRVQILKDIQARNPDFAEWVNEATAWVNEAGPNVAKGGTDPSSKSPGPRRPIFGKGFPVRK